MKPYFTGRYINEQIDHQLWRVYEEFSFTNSFGITTVVEEGFKHDKGSIPPIAQSLVSKDGYWTPACIVHDKQFRMHRLGFESRRTLNESNKDLLEGMRVMAKVWEVEDKDRRDWLIYGGVMAAGPEFWETPEERIIRLQNMTDNSHIIDN